MKEIIQSKIIKNVGKNWKKFSILASLEFENKVPTYLEFAFKKHKKRGFALKVASVNVRAISNSLHKRPWITQFDLRIKITFFRYQIACRSRTVTLLVSFRSLIMIQKFCAPLVSPSATNKSESDCDVVLVLDEGAQDRPVGKGHKCPPWVWSMRNWVGCENHQKYFIRIFN